MTETTPKNESGNRSSSNQDFDLEMLYVECSRCGRPLIWEKGTTTFLIQHSGIDRRLSPDWLMLSKGCPACSPDQDEFVLTLARPDDKPANYISKRLRFN